MLLLFALLMVLRSVILLRRDVLLAQLQIGFVQSRRTHVMRALTRTRWDVLARLRHGRVTHILGSDIFNLRAAVHFLVQSCVSAVMVAVQVVLAFILSPLLASFILLLLISGALTLKPLMIRSRDRGARVTESNLKLVSGANQFLSGLKHAISQNLHQSFIAEAEAELEEASSHEIAFARQRSITTVGVAAFSALLAGGAILVGTVMLDISPAALLTLLVVLTRMSGPVMQIQQSWQQIFHALPAYEKMQQLILDLDPGQHIAEIAAPSRKRIRGDVLFDAVRFSHERNDPSAPPRGVANLQILIPEGQFVGLKGPSGAGKTTFADLMVGLYAPHAGVVRIAGMPLEGETLERWRNSVSYVSQDPFMFHDSIRRNLLWAAPDASDEELWQALSTAGAADFVRRSALGLDTVLGERGMLVSGGERQRIALARALLRSPSLLILDEATNAIDVAGEQAILERLRTSYPRPTIVMIAHRDASLSFCDRILRFEEGQLLADE
jgi:ATP-binding cassette subfamily C protein